MAAPSTGRTDRLPDPASAAPVAARSQPVPVAHGRFVIETVGVTKRYGRRTAVDRLSLALPAGVVAGFVGPNGAGKTTTMSLLLGLVSPTGGTATVLGAPLRDPAAYLSRGGALIERPAFYPGLSGDENLRVLATIGGSDPAQIPHLLARVGLGARGGDRFGAYSMGMKQRLGIVAALLGDPALLILDEPTTGLDPAGIHAMRQLIGTLAEGGRTVFVSSHVLAELEQACDWFVIIDHGRLLFQGPAAQLMDGTATRLIAEPAQPTDRDRLGRLLVAKGYQVEVANGGLAVTVAGRVGHVRYGAGRAAALDAARPRHRHCLGRPVRASHAGGLERRARLVPRPAARGARRGWNQRCPYARALTLLAAYVALAGAASVLSLTRRDIAP